MRGTYQSYRLGLHRHRINLIGCNFVAGYSDLEIIWTLFLLVAIVVICIFDCIPLCEFYFPEIMIINTFYVFKFINILYIRITFVIYDFFI